MDYSLEYVEMLSSTATYPHVVKFKWLAPWSHMYVESRERILDQLYSFCDQTFHARWDFSRIPYEKQVNFNFQTKADAMLFKLRWAP